MTISLDLAYHAPASLDETLEILSEQAGRTVLLAGGTDVVPSLRDDLISPNRIVDLKRVEGLGDLAVIDGALHVGCLVTFSDLIGSPAVHARLPVLAEMAGMVASVGIRNRATLVGNICSAVPSCDAGPLLLALGARVHLVSREGVRTVDVDDWFEGPRRTAIRSGEVVTHVTIPLPASGHGAAYARLSRTRGEDLAQACVAVVLEPGDRPRIAFGAVAPTPVRARRIEALLHAQGLDAGAIDAAVGLVAEEVAPITDVRATRRYRLAMCEVMLRRAVTAAAGRAAGDGPVHGTPLM